MDIQEVLQSLETDGIEHLWVIFHDYSGRSCTKLVPKERFASVVERGVVFARADLDFTLEDHQAHGAVFLAEAGDFLAVPDPTSYTIVPYREATAWMHAWMCADGGAVWNGCPRTRLQHMVEAYAEERLSVQVSFESEVTLFTQTGDGEYQPADHDGMFTVTGLDRHNTLWREVINVLHTMGVKVEQFGKEYGPGQYELSTRHEAPIKAVDDYLTLKEVIRALARQAGWIASFMPKPYAHLPGNGLHLHMSLWDTESQREVSQGEQDDEPLSTVGRHFLGGLLKHASGLAGLGAPIINSYKRLLPGSWSPAHICWGVGNRAALVRIPALGRRRHIEFRLGDNACNPFIYLTAVLAAGLDGIKNQIEPPAPVTEDVGHLSDSDAIARGLAFLPRSLSEALDALESNKVIAEAQGPIILPEFLKVKRTELATYNLHVHPWERKVYLEAI
jgi:glutamine synthetase